MMGLPEKLVGRLNELGITEPTPIQSHAIPIALDGGDVMGLAQTGSACCTSATAASRAASPSALAAATAASSSDAAADAAAAVARAF